MNKHDLHCTVGGFFFPALDGSSKSTTKAWVEKLDIYFQLNPISEIESIKIAMMHLEGEAHEWWFLGLSTLGHAGVTAYVEFSQRLV